MMMEEVEFDWTCAAILLFEVEKLFSSSVCETRSERHVTSQYSLKNVNEVKAIKKFH